jgi:hypothetical protein
MEMNLHWFADPGNNSLEQGKQRPHKDVDPKTGLIKSLVRITKYSMSPTYRNASVDASKSREQHDDFPDGDAFDRAVGQVVEESHLETTPQNGFCHPTGKSSGSAEIVTLDDSEDGDSDDAADLADEGKLEQ